MMIHPLLDQKKQKKARQYEKQTRTYGLIGSLISLMFGLVYFFSGFSKWMSTLFPTSSVIWAFLLYMLTFIILSSLVGMPLSYRQGFVLEHKWGFSNHTRKTWFIDQLKSLGIGIILMPVLVGLLFFIWEIYPENWWLIASGAMVIVGVIFAKLFPVLILPIFNKYDLIEDESLIESLTIILEKAQLKPGGFYKEDMSRQTKKENAFLAGLGRTRRVVLGDNLLDNMTVPEITSVIAHEVGHYKHKHIWKNIIIGTVQQVIVFFFMDLIMTRLFPTFLDSTRHNLALFPMFLILMSLLSVVLFGPLSAAISRYFERQADLASLNLYPVPVAFKSAMAGLANRNLSNAYPEWWVKLLYYSHPPIGERLAFADLQTANTENQ